MTLEERIQALMESKSKLAEAKVKVSKDCEVDFDSGKDAGDEDQDADKEVDQDDEDQDSDKDGKDTDFSKQTKKNAVEVKEDASNDKLKAGFDKRDPVTGKLQAPPSKGDKQDDDGKTAKLKVGQSRKDTPTNSVKGVAASQEVSNKTNNVDDQTLATKPLKVTVGESINVLFDGENLSEEFKSKAETIFESAVSVLVEQRVAELEEEFQTKLEAVSEEVSEKMEEAVAGVQAELIENVSGFLDKVVGQWIDDNKVALESGIKVEMVTSFIDGLKTLFTENYIEVPEDKLDIVEAQAKKIAELEEEIETVNGDNDTLVEGYSALRKTVIVENLAKGMTLQQKEKFASLTEGLEYTSDEEFEIKAKTIKESYFKNGEVLVKSKPITEVKQDENLVSKYVTALSQPLKFSK